MRRLILALLLALALAVAGTGAAHAHVEVIEAEPAVDGEATAGQEGVEIRFAALDPGRPIEVEVTDAAGEDVTDGEPLVDERASTVEVPTRPLEVGQHIVHWHAWSDDGDGESEGTFRFEVVDAPGGGWGIWLVWGVALAVPAFVFLRPGARRRREAQA